MLKILNNNLMRTLSSYVATSAALIIFSCLIALLPSCKKGDDMDGLRGQWQLVEIVYPDGVSVAPDNPRRYISFDQNLLQLTSSDDKEVFINKYIGRVDGEIPDLIFSFPAYQGADKIEIISQWGIPSDPVAIVVEKRRGSSMTLKAGANILQLRKF